MTSAALLWLALLCLAMTFAAAAGAKALREFSRRELELLCRRRNRDALFTEISDGHARVAVGVDIVQHLASACALAAGCLWLLRPWEQSTPPSVSRFAATLTAGALLLLAAEIWLPWAVVRLWSATLLYYTWGLWRAVHAALWPLTAGVIVFEAFVRRLAGRPTGTAEDEEDAFEDEIRTIVSAGLRDGLLEEDAGEMIEGVIELGDADVSDIMTPRSDIDALPLDLSWPEVLEFVIRVGRTRIPVYRKTLDDIAGVLYVKDLLPELGKEPVQRRQSLGSLLREASFVPKTRPVDDLLHDFLHARNHMAIVVDEYKTVAGVVTIEDALEEIVGEIVDESDKDEQAEIEKVGHSLYQILGKAHLDEINERTGLALPEEEEFDTIGGFVMSQLGRVPKPGETVETAQAQITVLEANTRRVDLVQIQIVERPQRESA